MRVKAVERGVENAGPKVGLNDLRDQLEPAGHAKIRVLGPTLLFLGELLEPTARLVGGQGGGTDESQQGVVVPAIDARELIEGGPLGLHFFLGPGELQFIALEALD